MNDNRPFGKQGEDWAAAFLEQAGYTLLERNYRKRTGEADLVAWDPAEQEYVFVEVKTRSSWAFGYPEEAVGAKKRRTMAAVALLWMEEHGKINAPWRLDVLAITASPKPHIEHIRNITPHGH